MTSVRTPLYNQLNSSADILPAKKIGLQWRSEKPEVVEAFKKEAEDQKRQHAIDHPGYRYQPRKPSEKKKRMTKNKLAKLAAESGSTNLTMDMTNVPAQHANVPAQLANVPAQLDLSDQLYDPLAGEQLSFDMIPENWDSAIVATVFPPRWFQLWHQQRSRWCMGQRSHVPYGVAAWHTAGYLRRRARAPEDPGCRVRGGSPTVPQLRRIWR